MLQIWQRLYSLWGLYCFAIYLGFTRPSGASYFSPKWGTGILTLKSFCMIRFCASTCLQLKTGFMNNDCTPDLTMNPTALITATTTTIVTAVAQALFNLDSYNQISNWPKPKYKFNNYSIALIAWLRNLLESQQWLSQLVIHEAFSFTTTKSLLSPTAPGHHWPPAAAAATSHVSLNPFPSLCPDLVLTYMTWNIKTRNCRIRFI
jgi:hypothetical protein